MVSRTVSSKAAMGPEAVPLATPAGGMAVAARMDSISLRTVFD